jgi:MFS superfamily sulfate permease-like transporter
VNKLDWLVFNVALLCTMFAGVDIGLGISIGVSVFLALYKTAFPKTVVLGRLPETTVFRCPLAPFRCPKTGSLCPPILPSIPGPGPLGCACLPILPSIAGLLRPCMHATPQALVRGWEMCAFACAACACA